MTKTELAIPVYKLAFLKEYPYEILTFKKTYESNFKHTRWYLNENFSEKILKNFMSSLKTMD